MVQEIGRGTLGKLIGAIVIGAIVVGGGTYLEPWTQEYEVKTAINLTCSDMMRFRHEGPIQDQLRAQLMSRLTRAMVKPKPEAVTLSSKHIPGKLTCEGKIVYDTSTPWIGITMLKPDIPPLKLHHVVVVKKEVSDAW